MNMLKKCFTVPRSLWDDLTYISQRTGVSRSAVLVDFLAEPVADVRRMMEQVPDNPTPDDIRRARGESKSVVEERIAAMRRLYDDDGE